MKEVNLFYWKYIKGCGNFGDELSIFIVKCLLNNEKYKLITGQTTHIMDSEIILPDKALVRCYDEEDLFIGIAKYDQTNNIYFPYNFFHVADTT